MTPNLKPTLLASVIAAVIYAPTTYAATCPTTANSLNFSSSITYDNDCTVVTTSTDGTAQGASVNQTKGTAKFQKGLTIRRTAGANVLSGAKAFLTKQKGVLTIGGTDKSGITISGNFTATYDQEVDALNSRMVLIRHKDTSGGLTLEGEKNIITIGSDNDPVALDNTDRSLPFGAAIENHSEFKEVSSNDEAETIINNSGKINGLAQYDGTMTFKNPLTINSIITVATSDTKIDGERQNGAVLVSGGTATFNKLTIYRTNTRAQKELPESKRLKESEGQGAGIVLRAYKPWNGYASWEGTNYKPGTNKAPKASVSNELTIKTHNGAGIQLTHGNLEHTGSKATIDVSGAGHGIEVTKDAGGALADSSKTTSQNNWVQLADGTIPEDYKSTDDKAKQGAKKLAIGIGSNATITTNHGDGINIANISKDNIKYINIHNAGTIKTKTGGRGDAIDLSALKPATEITDSTEKDELKSPSITIINEGGTLSAENGYALYGSDYNDTFTSNGGTLVGEIDMQNGWDTVTFDGTNKEVNISGITKLDGGIDTKSNNEFDTLILKGTIINPDKAFDGDEFKNWEKVRLQADSTLKLTGTNTQAVTIGDESLESGLFIENNGTLISKGNATTIKSRVSNKGTIELNNDPDKRQFNTLTIDGDYEGGGVVKLHTLLTDDPKTDKLVLKGKVSGETKVKVIKVNKDNENPTKANTDGIQLIDTTEATMPKTKEEKEKTFSFSGDAIQAGAYLYNKLTYKEGKGFYLQSKYNPTDNGSGSSTPEKDKEKDTSKDNANSNAGNDGNHGSYQPEIYRPAVSGYSVAQLANHNAVIGMLGNHLHQRVDEQQVLDWNGNNHDQQIWGRIRHESLSLNGKQRFDLDQKTQYAQFGWDLDINRNDQNGRQHSGIYVAYAHADADVSDRGRIATGQQSFTGNIKGNIYGVGGYHTRYDEDGNYVDLIGGIHFVNNKYSDVLNGSSSQKGLGLSASAEAGMPITISETDNGNWFVEPQAELTWQMTNYRSFKDGITEIDGYTSHSLRPRLGVRFGYNDKPADGKATKDFHLTASIIQELIAPAQITVGGTGIKDDIGKDTWLEIGIGGQFPINKSTYIYGSAQYLHTLNNNTRRGVTGQAGIRFNW